MPGVAAASGTRAGYNGAMRFAVFVRATQESEAGQMPDAASLNEMGKFNTELQQAGAFGRGGCAPLASASPRGVGADVSAGPWRAGRQLATKSAT
jgi:hypothetical protein